MTLILPSEELQILIREEMNENVETRDRDLEHIKSWLKQQPHLPDEWGDVQLMNYLRASYFSLERAKVKIDKHFTVRAGLPEFFIDRDIRRPELQKLVKFGQACALPQLTPKGKRVLVVRGYDKNLATPNVTHFIRIVFMFADIRLKEELYGVTGEVVIFDASILTAGHFSRAANPVLLKKFLVCLTSYPVKVKEIHVVNAIPMVDKVINWIMLLVKEKHRQLVHVHTSFETLYEYIPREILPEEYGGGAGSLVDITNNWIKKLEDYVDWFKEHEHFKADESKRPGKPTNYDDLFGLDGSFKQLTID